MRYTVAGYNSAGPDRTEWTLGDRWESAVAGVEAITGITMAAIRPFEYAVAIEHMAQPRRLQTGRSADAGGRDMTLLTRSEGFFTEISYANPTTAAAYPSALALTVTAPGRLDTTIWRQELMSGDLLIRRTDTTHPSRRHATSSPVTPLSCPPRTSGGNAIPSPSATVAAPNRASHAATGTNWILPCGV